MALLQRRSSKKSAASYLPMCGQGSPAPHRFGCVNTFPTATPPMLDQQENYRSAQAPLESRRSHPSLHFSFTGRQLQKNSSSTRGGWLFGAAVLVFLPWVPALVVRFRYQVLQQELHALLSSRSEAVNDLRQITEDVSRLNRQARNWEKENDDALRELRKNGIGYVQHTDDKDYQELELLEEELLNRIDLLQSLVQGENRKSIQEKIGEGPHLVEFKLSDPLGTKNGGRFVVELAPLSLMPHAVHHFLQMVSNRLWDGLAMVHQGHASNVVQATPLHAKTTQRADDRFEKAKITKLSFAEHHRKYPCLPYTLAFSGTPGGPDFYITVENDTDVHTVDEKIHDEGESCFGRVVEGKEVIDNFVQNRGKKNFGILAIDIVRLVTDDPGDNFPVL
jgi:cyclophilin family peptidyl-prolyl cis-trans isomerase